MLLKTTAMKWIGFAFGVFLLILCILSSIKFGLTHMSWQMIVEAYSHYDGTNEQIILRTSRVPRALIAVAVGASLAIAGVLMQVLTRNPLASPELFGLNSGASFFIVSAVCLFSLSSLSDFLWIAFLGAAAAAASIYVLGSIGSNGLTPMKLTLAGAAMMALFSSLTHGMLVINERALDEVLFWLAGSVEGRKLEMLYPVLPYFIFAAIAAFALSGALNVLMMGDDVAKGLGQRTVLIKFFTWLLVVLFAGGSVAIAGPISFIGIVIPHFARALVGQDHRWIIPYSGMLGAILLLLADIGARYVIMPEEVPVGVMTAIIGTPFFVYVARKGLRQS